MKAAFKSFALLCVIALASCSGDPVRQVIPGTYVNHEGGDYSVADDSLAIEPVGANGFTIKRRTGYNLIREGRKGKREYETENWTALYDEKTNSMTVTKIGKVLIFYSDGKSLTIGNRRYKKIN